MRKINKGPVPAILIQNAATWKREYLVARRTRTMTDTIAHRYRHPEIKRCLEQETHGKCAYCESKMLHITPGDIEHIKPKKRRPGLVVDWNNLTLACEKCNREEKRDYYNIHCPIVNPNNEEPNDFLDADGEWILAKHNNVRGSVTIRELNLNRVPLLEVRKDRLRSLNAYIKSWKALSSGPAKDLVANEIARYITDDAEEYLLVIRAFLYDELSTDEISTLANFQSEAAVSSTV